MTDDNHTTKICKQCRQAQPVTIEFFQRSIDSRDGFRGVCRLCIRVAQTLERIEGASKRCTICHEEKPATTEFFQTQVGGAYGLRGQCRACRTVLNDERGKAFAEEWQKVPDVIPMKVCTKCQQEKPATLEFFRVRAEGHDGLRAQCRVCHDPGIHLWAQNNPEKVRAGIRRWNAEHPEQRRLNAQKQQANHPEKARERVRRYTKTSKGRINNTVHSAKRRARKIALPDHFTKDDWLFCLNYWAYSCAICGNQEGFLWKIAADHWIPILDQEHCPGTVPWNMLPLCHGHGGCNNSKHASEPVVWLEKKLGKTKAKKKLQEIQVYFDKMKSR